MVAKATAGDAERYTTLSNNTLLDTLSSLRSVTLPPHFMIFPDEVEPSLNNIQVCSPSGRTAYSTPLLTPRTSQSNNAQRPESAPPSSAWFRAVPRFNILLKAPEQQAKVIVLFLGELRGHIFSLEQPPLLIGFEPLL